MISKLIKNPLRELAKTNDAVRKIAKNKVNKKIKIKKLLAGGKKKTRLSHKIQKIKEKINTGKKFLRFFLKSSGRRKFFFLKEAFRENFIVCILSF